MITLYRSKESSQADAIEEEMKSMVLAYQVKVDAGVELPDNITLPAIKDGKKVICEDSNIQNFLEELKQELRIQRSVTGDACYIDPKTGDTC